MMNSLMINKLAGAVLTAGIAFFVFGWFGNTAVRVRMPAQAVIPVDMGTPAPTAVAAAAPAGPEPILPLLASADVTAGQATTKVCGACHKFNEGGANGVGPALYGVVGRDQAKAPGYAYSAALSGKGGKWTYEELNAWLYKPATYAPGTKMGYPGLPAAKDRANLIAYMRTMAASPEPLPDAAAIAKEAADLKQSAPAQAAAAQAAPAQAAPGQAAAKPPAPAPSQSANAAPAAVGASPAPAGQPFPVLLASASADAGKADTLKLGCIACHKFNEGGANGVGPALYGVVGREKASVATYTYSAALKGKGGAWTYDALNEWLLKPAAYAPGTKMSYAGIADDHTRADVIAYLRSLAAAPEPLPAADAKAQ